jgi:hypothetical protein
MAILNRPTQLSRFANTNAFSATSQVEQLARQLADQIIREREQALTRQRNGRIYTNFNTVDDVLANNVETVTRGLFYGSAGSTGSLSTFFTSSTATAIQNTYYREVYATSGTDAIPQFSIAYGHYNGSGSADLTGNLNNDTPSRAIYKQYAQILLPPNDYKFTINGTDTDHIYVLNFNRARYREKLDPGNLEINLADLSGSVFGNSVHTGSNVTPLKSGNTGYGVVRLIDDSSLTNATVGEAGQVYNIVSGTIDEGTVIHNPSSPIYFGLMYPQYGIVILNADTLNTHAGFNTVTGSGVQGDNAMKLFISLSGSIANHSAPAGDNYGLQARSSEQVKSTYYFVRIKNGEYNYSNNPTFVTGSLGQIVYSTFINDPQTYITTVGLYNDRRELLAVAKLSRPLLKSFTREALIKVKLDF